MMCKFIMGAMLFALFAVPFCPDTANAGKDRESAIVEVIVDTGATMLDEDREAVTKLFLGALRDSAGRQLRKARLDVILTSEPTTVWSGTRKELRTDIRRLLEKIKPTDKCSDLSRAIREAETNMRVAHADKAYLFIFASMIDTPFPCNQDYELPQTPNPALELGELARRHNLEALLIFGVNPHQKRPWLLYVEREGILAMDRQGKIDFELYDFAQSRAVLMNGELLRRR